jgi:hypothetical protein
MGTTVTHLNSGHTIPSRVKALLISFTAARSRRRSTWRRAVSHEQSGSRRYAELIITPDVQLLSGLAHVNGTPLFMHPLFRRRARRVEPRVQSFRARFLHWARTARHRDVLEAEELVLALLRATLQSTETRQGPNGISTSRLIRRTKEYLEGNLSNRILLSDVAREAGASPAYLTDLFRRVEGVSLH